jgi:hypothetical protein
VGAGGGNEDQDHELGAAPALGPHQRPRHDEGETGDREDDDPRQGGEPVDDDHALEELGGVGPPVVDPVDHGGGETTRQAKARVQRPPARPGTPLHIDQQESDHRCGDDQLRSDGEEGDVGHWCTANRQPTADSRQQESG